MQTSINETYHQIFSQLKDIRQMFLRILQLSINTQETKGTCLFASHLIKFSLEKCRNCSIYIRGGDGLMDGGYKDENGNTHGHYWAEIHENGQVFIADITADQFGAEPIALIPLNQNTQYFNGDQESIEYHYAFLLNQIESQKKKKEGA